MEEDRFSSTEPYAPITVESYLGTDVAAEAARPRRRVRREIKIAATVGLLAFVGALAAVAVVHHRGGDSKSNGA